MKYKFLVLLAAFGLAGNSPATLIMDEPFDYDDGSLVTVSPDWSRHSGTEGQTQVLNDELNLSRSNSEDVNRVLAGGPYTSGKLYVSFVVNFSELPFQTYFAHFNSSSAFRGRIFATTTGAGDGSFRVGIANGSSSPQAVIERDLSLGEDYLLVLRLDLENLNAITNTAWINPSSETSLIDRAQDTNQVSTSGISEYAFRQTTGIGTFTLDDLKIGTEFSDVASGGNTATNPPVISSIPDQSIPMNGMTEALPFTVNDGETPADNLVVTAASDNPVLVPNDPANILLVGSGTDRSITIVPALNQEGITTISVTVEDGDNNTTRTTFAVQVGAPFISAIPNQITIPDTATPAIPFVVGDAESPAESLIPSASSSNPTLLPPGSFVFGGSGSNRTVTITPAAGESGFAFVTVSISDGSSASDSSFALSVNRFVGTDIEDNFDSYADGSLVVNSGGIWSRHSGTPEQMQVLGGKVQLTQEQSEDVNTSFFFGELDGEFVGYYPTNQGYVIYSSFSVRFSVLPRAGDGDYFAHLKPFGSSFRARIHTTTNGVPEGYYRLGIANGSGSASAVHPTDLALQDLVIVTTRYVVDTAETVLWVNALTEADTSVSATDTTEPVDIYSYAFRQGNGIGVMDVDDLLTGGAFSDVFQQPPSPNTTPTISAIADQETAENASVGPLDFTVSDAETAADDLVITVHSTDIVLVPESNIIIGGSGENRTVTVNPATDESGLAIITLTVTDEGGRSADSSFQVTVLAANNPPFVSVIPDQQTPTNTSTAPIAFVIGDRETQADDLTLAGFSSDELIVPNGNIVFGGSGSNRTVTVTPIGDMLAAVDITVSVSDGEKTTDRTFALTLTLADLLVEPFEYVDGALTDVSAGLWAAHSGSGNGPVQVTSGKITLSQDSFEDINALIAGRPFNDETNSIKLYAGLTINMRELPGDGAGTYFAHFKPDGSGSFRGKVSASTANAEVGKYRLAIANDSNSSAVQYPMDLSLDTEYRVVVRYDAKTGSCSLWINPSAETDPSVEAVDVGIITVGAFAFRQSSSSGGIGVLEVDDLIVGTTFAGVIPEPGVALEIVPGEGGVEISWPAAATGYVLESTDTLPDGTWTEYPDQGTVLDGVRTVTVDSPTGVEFFRLVRQ